MTPQKLTGFHKFVCFVFVVILVLLIIGFAVNGWQTDDKLPDSGDVGNTTDDTDENNNGTSDTDDIQNNETTDDNPEDDSAINTVPPEEEPVIYICPMTGLEISESRYNTLPIGTVNNPTAPLYGVSHSDLAIEFPIEDGSSRLLTYTTAEETLWKIGALTSTRSFISDMATFLGGIIVSYGKDGVISNGTDQADAFLLDISKYSDCYYVENTRYIYTTENMIELAKSKNSQSGLQLCYKTAPYDFYESGEFSGTANASTVIIPYSDTNETELYYHEKTGQYLYYKSANRKMDMLTGKNVSFKNVFILFANTTTYEKTEGSELIVDVDSGGKGFYISDGSYVEFKWETDISGSMSFYTLSGERLKVNPGNSYFAYYKSSQMSKITLI